MLGRILRILITAYADIEVVIDSINKGNVYRYFKKPWEHEDIRTGVMRGIEHYHSTRERERLQAEKIENMKNLYIFALLVCSSTNTLAAPVGVWCW